MSKTNLPANLIGKDTGGIIQTLNVTAPALKAVLPTYIPADKFLQIMASNIRRNPDIAKCTTESILGSCIFAAIVGLDPTPELNLIHFIPRGSQLSPEIGYQGWIALMHRNPAVKKVYAYIVREGDVFEETLGDHPQLKHIPQPFNDGEKIGVYAVVHLETNGIQSTIFRTLSKKQVLSRMKVSQAKNSKYSPWNTDFDDEMWMKTAIRHIRKWIPVTEETQDLAIATATQLDNNVITPEMFDYQTKQLIPPKDTNLPKEETKPEAVVATKEPVKDKTESKQQEPPPPEPPDQKKTEPKIQVDWLKELNRYEQFITFQKNKEYWQNLPGEFGYASFSEVTANERPTMLEKLKQVMKEINNGTR